MADRYDAYINGILLEMETLEDSWEKAIARHDIPYADYPDLDDMGLKSHGIKVRCYFWDGPASETYESHKDLVRLLKEKNLLELNHPDYGVLQVMIESVSKRADDRERTAEIDISFIEQRHESGETLFPDVEAAAELAFIDGQAEQMAAFSDEAAEALGAESQSILAKTLDAGQGVLEQFNNVSLAARNWLKKVDSAVATMEGALADIANPVNGIVAAVDYGVNLPGRVIGSVARCAERYVALAETLKTAPARFLESFRLGMLELEDKTGIDFGHHVRLAAAQRAAFEAGTIFKADEQERQKLRSTENSKSFDTQGRYLPQEQAANVMTARDLEQCLATVRTLLQEGVDRARGMQTLKTQARLLVEHVNTVKLQREKIITVRLDNAMPLHLVCLKYGLPYNAAERIHRLNRIKNPNFTDGEVMIYAR